MSSVREFLRGSFESDERNWDGPPPRCRSPVRKIMRSRLDLEDNNHGRSGSRQVTGASPVPAQDKLKSYDPENGRRDWGWKKQKKKGSVNTDIYGNEYQSILQYQSPHDVMDQDLEEILNKRDQLLATFRSQIHWFVEDTRNLEDPASEGATAICASYCENIFREFCRHLELDLEIMVRTRSEKRTRLYAYRVEMFHGISYYEQIDGEFLTDVDKAREYAYALAALNLMTKFGLELCLKRGLRTDKLDFILNLKKFISNKTLDGKDSSVVSSHDKDDSEDSQNNPIDEWNKMGEVDGTISTINAEDTSWNFSKSELPSSSARRAVSCHFKSGGMRGNDPGKSEEHRESQSLVSSTNITTQAGSCAPVWNNPPWINQAPPPDFAPPHVTSSTVPEPENLTKFLLFPGVLGFLQREISANLQLIGSSVNLQANPGSFENPQVNPGIFTNPEGNAEVSDVVQSSPGSSKNVQPNPGISEIFEPNLGISENFQLNPATPMNAQVNSAISENLQPPPASPPMTNAAVLPATTSNESHEPQLSGSFVNTERICFTPTNSNWSPQTSSFQHSQIHDRSSISTRDKISNLLEVQSKKVLFYQAPSSSIFERRNFLASTACCTQQERSMSETEQKRTTDMGSIPEAMAQVIAPKIQDEPVFQNVGEAKILPTFENLSSNTVIVAASHSNCGNYVSATEDKPIPVQSFLPRIQSSKDSENSCPTEQVRKFQNEKISADIETNDGCKLTLESDKNPPVRSPVVKPVAGKTSDSGSVTTKSVVQTRVSLVDYSYDSEDWESTDEEEDENCDKYYNHDDNQSSFESRWRSEAETSVAVDLRYFARVEPVKFIRFS